jgi:hypothetical protein
LVLTLALVVGAGSVTPSFGIWPFSRRDKDVVPDALPYTVEVVFNGGTRREQRALRNSSNLYALRREPPSGIVGLLSRARADVPRRFMRARSRSPSTAARSLRSARSTMCPPDRCRSGSRSPRASRSTSGP